MTKTPPIGLRWPQELFDLYQAKAAELTHLSGGKHKFTVSSLAIAALEQLAKREDWTPEKLPSVCPHCNEELPPW